MVLRLDTSPVTGAHIHCTTATERSIAPIRQKKDKKGVNALNFWRSKPFSLVVHLRRVPISSTTHQAWTDWPPLLHQRGTEAPSDRG